MRTIILAAFGAAILAASPVAAQPPSAVGAAPAPEKLCTTTTTVVRRGDVVVSTTSNIKCEDESAPGGGAAKAVFGAPAGALSTLGKAVVFGGGERATASNVRGDWKVMDSRADRVCHLFLTSQPDPAGFRVRRTDCRGDLSRLQAWTFDDGGVALHAVGGDVVVRLAGSREQLDGRTAAGDPVRLQR